MHLGPCQCSALPKAEILSKPKKRGDTVFFKQTIEGKDFIAAGHMDRHPMLLVGTCGTSNPASTIVKRTCYRISKVTKQKIQLHYEMEQPQMFEIYRSNFNSIDHLDRLALGPHSLAGVWRTKNVVHRILLPRLPCVSRTHSKLLHASIPTSRA